MYSKFIFQKTKAIKQAFKNRSVNSLKKIQYECIEHLAIEFNENVFNLAIICYMISKMVSKPRYWQTKGITGYQKKIELSLENILLHYEKEEKISKIFQEIMQTINLLDIYDKKHIFNLLEGAKLKIGSSLYTKGMSLGIAADLSGADRIEIMQYIGKTTIHERIQEPIDIKKRLEGVRKIFG